MTDTNTFNFENYGQEQTGFFQTTEENAQFINQNESPIEPSTYYQGDAVLQETAGFGENIGFSNQNTTTFNPDSLDSNAIFGQTLQTETVVPDSFGQTFQDTTTTTTNVIEGNNYFDTTNQIQTQDTNTYFDTTNYDTTQVFTQEQPIQQTTTTTTETNTYFGETQDIQPQFGETQILQGVETNQFFDANPNDFGQIQPQEIQGNNIYEPYQATKTEDLNSFGYGTTETQQVINPVVQPELKIEQATEPYFPTVTEPITQTQTTTTTTKTVFEPNPLPQFPQGPLDYEPYPASNVPAQQKQSPQPQFNVTQFQQTLDATPVTTSQVITQQQVVVPPPAPKIVATPQPVVQATYTPPPKVVKVPVRVPKPAPKPPVQIKYVTKTVPRPAPVTYTQTTNIVTPPPAPVVTTVPQQQIIQQTYQTQTVTPTPVTQPGLIPGYQYVNKLVDEDFRRGRPVYNEPGVPSSKLRAPRINNQLNQINTTPTYKVGNIVGLNRNKIGLSRLAHGNSYNKVGINTPSLNKLVPTINTPNINVPNINTPNINVPTINTPKIDVPTINTPNINVPTINTPNINVPTINTPNINVPTINTPNINVPTINTPNIKTNLGNALNDNVRNINTNINNVVGDVNSGLDKIGKASSYNVGANTITPLLNNAGLNVPNVKDNVRLPQLKDFL